MSKPLLHNRTKNVIQLAIIALIIGLVIVSFIDQSYTPDYEAYCPFGGIMSLGSNFWVGSMSCSMSSRQLFLGIALIIGVIVFSKLFCGYVCPIGTVTEWLNKFFGRSRFSIFMRGIPDRLFRIGKYGLLFFTAYYTVISSELFCKKFDPYYATVSGFDSDVVVWAGILTILTVVILSVLIRFFWCKYACPLNALSNIFQNFWITLPIFIIYFILYFAGVRLHILWLILALCVAGALTEVFRFRFYSLSPFRISVDKRSCTSCSLCDLYCPQGIPVSEYDQVTHPDCTLCMDCMKACKYESITLGKSRATWLPAVALGGLFVLALMFASNFQLTTLSERWGNFEQLDKVATLEMKELKTVKCFGSAKSLQTQLQRKNGIVGMDAWAEQNRIMIYYNPEIIDESGVKQAVFKPSKYRLRRNVTDPPQTVTVFQVPVEGLFDLYDNYHLIRMLRKNEHIYGLATRYGEPVEVNVLFATGTLEPDQIIAIIEQDTYIRETEGQSEEVDVDFSCEGTGALVDTLEYDQFVQEYFAGYDRKFNDYDQYIEDELRIFEIGLPAAENSVIRRRLGLLTSHLSFNDGIVRVRTLYRERPALQVYYDPAQVTPPEIEAMLKAEQIKYMVRGGATKQIENPFSYAEPMHTLPVAN